MDSIEDIKEIIEKSREREKTLRSRFGQSVENETVFYDANVFEQTQNMPSSSTSSIHSAHSETKKVDSPSVTKVESEMQGTKETPTRYLNIHKENLQMQIKLTSMDNCKVQVEIHDNDNGNGNDNVSNSHNIRPITSSPKKFDSKDEGSFSMRTEVKNKLNRLGKLYSGVENNSPIHRTEDKISIGEPTISEKLRENAVSGIRMGKLAALTQNINDWEDDTKHSSNLINSRFNLESRKSVSKHPLTTSSSNKSINSMSSCSSKNGDNVSNISTASSSCEKPMDLDKSVLDTLEAQGYKRVDSTSKLVYKYEDSKHVNEIVKKTDYDEPKVITNKENKPSSDKQSTKIANKDPSLLSISERKALFEKNKGNPVLPKCKSPCIDKIKKPSTVSVPSKPRNSILKVPAISSILDEEYVDNKPSNRNSLVAIKSSKIATRVAAIFEEKSRQNSSDCNDSTISENNFNYSLEKKDVKPSKNVKIVDVKMKSPFKSLGGRLCDSDTDGGNDDQKPSVKVKSVLGDIKKIRVSPAREGHLYPNVSDIETATETETSTTVENSENSSNAVESFNNEEEDTLIDETANMTNEPEDDSCNLTISKKRPNDSDSANTSGTSDLSNLLMNDVDDYLKNESFVLEGPTPPKLFKRASKETVKSEASTSFRYKDYKDNIEKMDTSDLDVKNESSTSLMHTVSFYRKQQNRSSNDTPVRVVIERKFVVEESDNGDESDFNDVELIEKKIVDLTEDVSKQQTIISQTSQALNFCCSTVEFSGSVEHVEAEKLLLVATHKRQALINEIQRLKVERTLRPKNRAGKFENEYGVLTIANIRIPLKPKYTKALKTVGGKGHHILCILRCEENIVASQLVSTMATNSDSLVYVEVPGTIVVNPVYADFTAELEFYCLQAQDEFLSHEDKYHIKKNLGNKLTPKHLKNDSKLSKSLTQSPAGPKAVRTSEFSLMGYVMFSLQTIKKSSWTLNNVSQMSPLDGTVHMKISCQLLTCVEHKGFLTMFDDVSGLGAWHRRWCLLKGNILNCWMYPDDEKKKAPLDSIDLRSAITEEVKPVNRELCARQNTLLIECIRDRKSNDVDSLTTICRKDKTILRYLLSADTKDERNDWCEKFTKTLKSMRAWGSSNV